VLDFGIAKLEEASFTPLADVSGEYLVRDSSKTRVSDGSATQADEANSATEVDPGNATIVGEGETLALNVESDTIVGREDLEAGTLIQDAGNSEDEESGTVVEDAAKTSILKPVEAKGTKIISNAGGTDEPSNSVAGTADLTRAGAVLGTPLYMSPEQCRGEKLSSASDIYSLSVIIYQMLSGKLPFTGDYVEVMEGHKELPPPPLQGRHVSKNLKGVVMTSMSKDALERPESAEALASKLRSNSEGLGVLLRRAVIIYSEHLPKFVLLAIIAFLPLILITYLRVIISFLYGTKVITSDVIAGLNSAGLGIAAFFLQIVTAAILVGTTTWIVGQILAFPLRPLSLRAAFGQVRQRWKQLAGTVTLATLLSLAGWVIGGIGGVLGGLHFIAGAAGLFGSAGAGIAAVLLVIAGSTFGGASFSSFFMLIAPSIMMEGISGRRAFRRSKELTLRSFRTVFPTALLAILVPFVLAAFIGFTAGSTIKRFELAREIPRLEKEIEKMKREGVVAVPEPEKQAEDTKKVPVNVSFGVNNSRKIEIVDSDKNNVSKQLSKAFQEGIFEIIWTPIAILISSLISVITALIYFKTRQAGGESLYNLLGKLDDSERLQTKWEQRVRERLIQSGKVTTGRGGTNH
jgi:hypothetical protein